VKLLRTPIRKLAELERESDEKAIGLYKALGAEFRDRWRSVLLTDDALRQLAERTS
jgi:hypothetical protein